MRTRGFWPTASRIALIMSFTRRLADGRYLNVTKSIDDHPDFTQQDGDVRMLAKIAGLVVGPHPSGKISMCRCVQVVDGDLGGWLPSSIVSLVTTQAFPISMRRVNKRLKKIILPRAVSALIRQAESSIAAPAPVLATAAAPLAISKPAGKSVKEKLSVIKKILLLLDKIQPFLVLYLFLAQVFRRRK